MDKNNSSSQSPLPNKPKTKLNLVMDFAGAINAIAAGACVTRTSWNDDRYYLKLVDDRLKIHKPDDVFYDLIVSGGDISGKDWIII